MNKALMIIGLALCIIGVVITLSFNSVIAHWVGVSFSLVGAIIEFIYFYRTS